MLNGCRSDSTAAEDTYWVRSKKVFTAVSSSSAHGYVSLGGLTFELTGILRWAGFGLGFFSPNLDCRKNVRLSEGLAVSFAAGTLIVDWLP